MRFLFAANAAFLITATTFAQTPTEKTAPIASKPTQKGVAAKGAFSTIGAADAKVKSATKATDLNAAKKTVSKTAAFSGTVAKVFTPKGNGLVLLNFANDYKTAIIGVVDDSDFAKFPDLQTLVGKKVWVSGKVENYKGQPEVRLNSPDAIKIIQ